MKRVRLAIDAAVRAEHGPEVHWIVHTLLEGLGYAWEHAAPGEPCDLAYTSAPPDSAHRLWIRADGRRWGAMRALQLREPVRHDGLWAFRFGDEPTPAPLGPSGESVHCAHDRVFDAFWLASGLAECGWPKSRFGHFHMDASPLHRAGVFRDAPVSALARWIQTVLEPVVGPPLAPRWPAGACIAACGSHDVDYPETRRMLEPLRVLGRQGLRGAPHALGVLTGRLHHWQFDEWMRVERELGMRSAFYFVARCGSLLEYATGVPDPFYDVRRPEFARLFATLRDAGFEVGMQASYEAYRSLERFAGEKALLEQVLGGPVLGNRHHYWHVDPADPEATLILHEQAGLVYDASLAFEHAPGWRRGLAWPFFPYSFRLRRPLRTLQLPTAWMDDQLIGHARLEEHERVAILDGLTSTVRAVGGLFLADIHEYVYDERLYPGWAKLYVDVFRNLASWPDVRMATPAQVALDWTERSRAIHGASLQG